MIRFFNIFISNAIILFIITYICIALQRNSKRSEFIRKESIKDGLKDIENIALADRIISESIIIILVISTILYYYREIIYLYGGN